MYYFGGMNVVEISGLLDVNRSTISRILNAADRRISKNIGQYVADRADVVDGLAAVAPEAKRVAQVVAAHPDVENPVLDGL